MVDADDYGAVGGTYPAHPLGEVKPDLKTCTELTQYRKLMEKLDIKKKKDGRDAKVAHLQKVQFKDYYVPQEYVEKPIYNSTWEQQAEDHVKARVAAGLEPSMVDVNPEKLPDPTIAWVDQPTVPSKSLLLEGRKRDGLADQGKFEKNVGAHDDGQARIENREACILRLSFKGLETVTMNRGMLKERRTKEMVEENTVKFGDQVLGVHGAELPKFAGHATDQFYWTMQKAYNKSPRC